MTPVLRILIFSWVGTAVATASAPEIISVRKIWDRAPHSAFSAFTDLVRYQGKWFCTFREGGASCGRPKRPVARTRFRGWRRVEIGRSGD